MQLLPTDIDYFKRGEYENSRFWSRFGEKPRFEGASVLDIGCGHGSLCIDMALSGAKKVVGLDINSQLIDFARENLKLNFPQLIDIVEFKDMDLKDYPEFIFDYIVSKDSFEHIIDLNKMLYEIKKRLRSTGKIYIGFGPLYNSPYGDHHRTKTYIPWGHLLIPETTIINRLNRNQENKIDSIHDLGLNKMSFSDYQRAFRESGLRIIYFKVNQSNHYLARVFSLIRKISFLKEYFSYNIYCVLEKRLCC